MLYCILNIKDLNNVPYKNWNMVGMQVIQDAADTVQTNLDNTKFTIGFWESNPPVIVDGKTTHTASELNNIINNPANGWIEEE